VAAELDGDRQLLLALWGTLAVLAVLGQLLLQLLVGLESPQG